MWELLRTDGSVKCFQWMDEPEVIWVIKTGFTDQFIIVHEDAYRLNFGKTEIHTAASLEEKYQIKF